MIKVRITNHVNYNEYTDIKVKDEDELDEMYDNSFDNLSEVDWIHCKGYGFTTHAILEEKDDEYDKR